MTFRDKTKSVTNLDIGDTFDNEFNPNEHEFHSILVSAKAHVCPLCVNLTVPRAELSGLVVSTRLQRRIAKNYSPGLSSAIMLGDSMCVISSMEKNATSFSPFFHTRVSECLINQEKIGEKVALLEQIHHVSSENNISDLATRKTIRVLDVMIHLEW